MCIHCIEITPERLDLEPEWYSRACRNRTALDRPKRPVQATTLHAREGNHTTKKPGTAIEEDTGFANLWGC